MSEVLWLGMIGAGALGLLAGYLWGLKPTGLLREENAALKARLEAEQKAAVQRQADDEAAMARVRETFDVLAGQALRSNSEQFLRLAREHLAKHQVQAEAKLTEKEKAIEGLLRPIRETLDKTERQLREAEQARKESQGALTEQIRSMAESQKSLEAETRRLVRALRRPEVRGQWGELTLRRLAELAGMVEHCDFYEQEQSGSGAGALRPDMIVRMPERRAIVVDVKTPLDAYLSAVEAEDDEARRQHLERHAKAVRLRVRELAAKAYWAQFDEAPDFVVLFIPGDQFLSAALQIDPALLEDALISKVIIATPTSFIALLRAVAYGWRQQHLAENAVEIRELGGELYRRLAAFTDHLAKVGRSLGQGVDAYNKAVGSLERSVLPGARKFTEMGIDAKKEIEELEPLEKAVRPLERD